MIPYLINNFRGGISDETSRGVVGSFKHGWNLDIHKRTDSLSCGSTMVTVFGNTVGVQGSNTGTTLTGIFNFLIPASDGSTYAFGSTGSIFAISGQTADPQVTFVYNDENGAILGAGEFNDTNGNNYLFWGTQTAIARKPFPGVNSAPDTGTARWTDVTAEWKTENISATAPWHTMKMANGALYIANNETISELDFSANWTQQKMNIRPGNSITSLEERDDYLILGSERLDGSEEGHIWEWISTVTNWILKRKIPVQGINALLYTELPLMQGGSNGEIFTSDFKTVVPLNGILGGGHVNPGGVTIETDLGMFGFYGGSNPGIWSYGRTRKNRPLALNYQYRLVPTINGSTISTIGAIVNVNGQILASWGTTDGSTSEYGVDQVSTTTYASSEYQGLEFKGKEDWLRKKVDSAKLVLTPMPIGTAVSLKYKMTRNTQWVYGVLGNNTTTFTSALGTETEIEFNISDDGEVYQVAVELTPNGTVTPEILSITSYLGKGAIHE